MVMDMTLRLQGQPADFEVPSNAKILETVFVSKVKTILK